MKQLWENHSRQRSGSLAQRAAKLDAADPLAPWRDRFQLPSDAVYLAGGGLGPLPHTVPQRVERALRDEWGQGGVRSWDRAGWSRAPERAGALLAPLLGARPEQVLVCDSTSINLFKLLGAALRLRPERRTVLVERDAFPSDAYIAASALEWLAPEREIREVPRAQLRDALDESVAVALFHHVDYRTGHLIDLDEYSKAAARVGALSLWDLSHSAGALPLALRRSGADLAVGCGYKHLCGGPGAPGFVYVRECWFSRIEQPLCGWLGHAEPFAFEAHYRPAPSIRRFLCGTPPMLSLLAFEAALEVLAPLDRSAVRAKSMALGDWFIECVEHHCAGFDIELASPRAAEQRGPQLAWRHREAQSAVRALADRGVIGDFRAPDLMRFGMTPWTVRFTDLEATARKLREVLIAQAESEMHSAPTTAIRAAP